MDLTPIPHNIAVSLDGEKRAEEIRLIHQKAKENLEKRTEQYTRQANKGRIAKRFEPGDWVWLHMRPERFPNQRVSKLSPRGDGPFKFLERINDNAYKIDLPGKFQVSNTFNVTDLASFDAGPPVLRSKPSQGGGNDEDIQLEPDQELEEPDQEEYDVPFVPNKPLTRAAARSLHRKFIGVIRRMMEQLEQLERTGEAVGQVLKPIAHKPPDKSLVTFPATKAYQDDTNHSRPPAVLIEDSKIHLTPGDEDQKRHITSGGFTSRNFTKEDHLATSLGQLTLVQNQSIQDHPGVQLKPKEDTIHGELSQDAATWVSSHLGPLRQITLSCLKTNGPE